MEQHGDLVQSQQRSAMMCWRSFDNLFLPTNAFNVHGVMLCLPSEIGQIVCCLVV